MKRYYILYYRSEVHLSYEDRLYYETIKLHSNEESAIDEYLDFRYSTMPSVEKPFYSKGYFNDQFKDLITNIFCK